MAISDKDINKIEEKLRHTFATKDDLEALDNRILLRNYATRDDLGMLETRLSDKILTSQDKIMKRIDDWRTEEKAWHLQIQRNTDGIRGCETRLDILEANRRN